ncbi:MAG: hypothetical protein JXR25_02685 [Pontiellaceae bacterium]|nr:hypothetical protein [Pontiellaceae bacterium]MBN2783709.1 hypothetical protein [Pontiellaceae bacterium]
MMIPKIIPVLLAALTMPCFAELLVDEPFDYAQGNLTGEDGGSGWSGAWTQDGESCVIVPVQLSYFDSNFNVLSVSGLSLATTGSATTKNYRDFANGPLVNVWISFLFRLPASNNLYEGINFYRGSSSIFAISNPSITTSANIALNNGSTIIDSGVGEFGKTYFIVLHLIANGAPDGTDLLELYLDPLLTGPVGDPVLTTSAADLSFDRIRIAGQNGATLEVDELRIGETFADIAPFTSEDPDGDGLTNMQELELGLNPAVSDAALIAAVQEHPDYFGLFTRTGILSSVDHGVVIEAQEGTAELVFEIQQSDDLLWWQHYETIHRRMELEPGKNFLRFILSGASL